MSGAIPPIPQYVFMGWCVVKHRGNFTLPYLVEMKNHTESLKARNHSEVPGIGGEDNIRTDLRETGWEGVCVLNSSGLGEGPVAGSCGYGTEPLVSIKGSKFLD
jgi:hypothetical protein